MYFQYKTLTLILIRCFVFLCWLCNVTCRAILSYVNTVIGGTLRCFETQMCCEFFLVFHFLELPEMAISSKYMFFHCIKFPIIVPKACISLMVSRFVYRSSIEAKRGTVMISQFYRCLLGFLQWNTTKWKQKYVCHTNSAFLRSNRPEFDFATKYDHKYGAPSTATYMP